MQDRIYGQGFSMERVKDATPKCGAAPLERARAWASLAATRAARPSGTRPRDPANRPRPPQRALRAAAARPNRPPPQAQKAALGLFAQRAILL